MQKLVTSFLDEANFELAHKELDDRIGNIKKFSVSLNDSERLGLRTVAEGREGYVRTVSRIALAHTESLPRNEDPNELAQMLAYYDRLGLLLQKLHLYTEMVDDTMMAAGVDIMAMTDRYISHLQTARSSNTSLDMAMNQVDDYNKRFTGRATAAEPVPVVPAPEQPIRGTIPVVPDEAGS
jgi:hypothetical protein